MRDKLNKRKGSAILLVIFTIVVVYIYASMFYRETTNAQYIQSKCEKAIKSTYGKDFNNLDQVYSSIINEQ